MAVAQGLEPASCYQKVAGSIPPGLQDTEPHNCS